MSEGLLRRKKYNSEILCQAGLVKTISRRHCSPQHYLTSMRSLIHSSILNENRTYWVYTPGPLSESPETEHRLIYLLDGEQHFRNAARALTLIPRRINEQYHLVILGDKNKRIKDFTPQPVRQAPFLNTEQVKETGGGEKYYRFLRDELIPIVEKNYTRTQRCILGHSLGGLECLHILLQDNNLFHAYIAIEPSIWYKQSAILHAYQRKLRSSALGHTPTFIAVANNISKRKHAVLPIRRFVRLLKQYRQKLQLHVRYYKHFQHFSLVPGAISDGIRWFGRQKA